MTGASLGRWGYPEPDEHSSRHACISYAYMYSHISQCMVICVHCIWIFVYTYKTCTYRCILHAHHMHTHIAHTHSHSYRSHTPHICTHCTLTLTHTLTHSYTSSRVRTYMHTHVFTLTCSHMDALAWLYIDVCVHSRV